MCARVIKYTLVPILFFTAFLRVASAQTISISEEEVARIAERVFANECFSKEECLIEWNAGEEFLSLGIGHFIWYPEGPKGPFEESFLKYLSYARDCGEKIPAWLNIALFPACPWNSRQGFLNNQQDPRLMELREFLLATKPRQAAFLIKRLEDALPLILDGLETENAKKISQKFSLLASSSSGIYALVDYINFKGLGILETERYQGQGWGLFQVLSLMNEQDSVSAAREEFVRAAKIILSQRVANSPPERNEQKWLAGWLARLESYLIE
jgi:hypothetical protein